MKVEASEVIDRPPEVVFQFVAVEHVANHPRWDSSIQLEQLSDGPLSVGTMIRRVNTRTGEPVEGTMEVLRYEPNRLMEMLIHDGPIEVHGRFVVEPQGEASSKLTMSVDILGMPDPLDPLPIERSILKMKELIESER